MNRKPKYAPTVRWIVVDTTECHPLRWPLSEYPDSDTTPTTAVVQSVAHFFCMKRHAVEFKKKALAHGWKDLAVVKVWISVEEPTK